MKKTGNASFRDQQCIESLWYALHPEVRLAPRMYANVNYR